VIARGQGFFWLKSWLSGMDSNHDKELQRLLCYHYTTGQGALTLPSLSAAGKGKKVGNSAAAAG
jgi:hypothetical protein